MFVEIEIIKALQSVGSAALDVFCEIISYLSSYVGFLFCLVVVAIIYQNRYTIAFALTYTSGVLFNYILKSIIARPRPYMVDSAIINKMSASGLSFPSGHCLSATIIICFLLFMSYKLLKKNWQKVLVTILLLCFLLLVVFSRMYLGQHYLTDTIAGIILGLNISAIGLFVYYKLNKNSN